jgi:hypothetical protein
MCHVVIACTKLGRCGFGASIGDIMFFPDFLKSSELFEKFKCVHKHTHTLSLSLSLSLIHTHMQMHDCMHTSISIKVGSKLVQRETFIFSIDHLFKHTMEVFRTAGRHHIILGSPVTSL